METNKHTINALFEQLGLASSEDSIERFLQVQTPLPGHLCLHQACQLE